jgi:hypothetical protein
MIEPCLFEHALIAAVVQTIIGLLTGKWWAGGALPSGYFMGRELAQAEYRWIEQLGTGLRADMPWNAAFDPRVWQTADQFADWAGPVLVTAAIALVAPQIAARRNRPALDDAPLRP